VKGGLSLSITWEADPLLPVA